MSSAGYCIMDHYCQQQRKGTEVKNVFSYPGLVMLVCILAHLLNFFFSCVFSIIAHLSKWYWSAESMFRKCQTLETDPSGVSSKSLPLKSTCLSYPGSGLNDSASSQYRSLWITQTFTNTVTKSIFREPNENICQNPETSFRSPAAASFVNLNHFSRRL